MPLIDKLREVAVFPPSHEPVTGEILHLLGVLIAYVEHGEELLGADADDRKARDAGQPASHVADLLSPPPPPEPSAAASGAAPPAAAPDKDAEIAALRQQLANAQAQLGRTRTDTAAPTEVSGTTPSSEAP